MNKTFKLFAAAIAMVMLATACTSDPEVETVTETVVDNSAVEAAEAAAEQAKADADAAIAEARADAETAQAEADANAARADEAEAAAADAAAMASESDASANPLAGTTVTVSGPERSDEEAGALQAALGAFADANDMTIFYAGSADWEADINIQLAAGNAPDISVFPQPGKLADFARSGDVLALPGDTESAVSENWSSAAMGFGNVDGTQFGVPNKNDLKSLVWYQPARFEAAGYDIPNTLDELWALSDTMIADGNTPWCIGIESGQATGWAFTDWIEDMMLRRHSVETYDAWVAGELPFSSPEVTGVVEEVLAQWNKPGAVFSASGSIAATAFQDNGEPLVKGDCMMHRQASFFSGFFPDGTPAADGSEGAIDVFYFPEGETGRPVLGAGTLVGAFADRPEVWAVMEYFGSAEYANARQVAQREAKGGGDVLSGFNTANLNADRSLWAPLEQSFLQIMADAEVLRFDASDLMPADVGAGTFWSEGTAIVNGDKSVADGLAAIDASWPS